MKNVIIGFKEFIMRGNVIDLAVGIVIGSAFATVVTSLVEGLLTPLIAAVFGARDLSNAMSFEINHALFSFGLVLNAVIHFLFVAQRSTSSSSSRSTTSRACASVASSRSPRHRPRRSSSSSRSAIFSRHRSPSAGRTRPLAPRRRQHRPHPRSATEIEQLPQRHL